MLSGDPCNGLPGSTSALRCSYEVSYNNQCGRSISGSVSGIGYTQNGEEQVNSASFTIPAGSGTKSGSVYFSREVVCGDVTISGHDSGNC